MRKIFGKAHRGASRMIGIVQPRAGGVRHAVGGFVRFCAEMCGLVDSA
jgi:hypothetical protein